MIRANTFQDAAAELKAGDVVFLGKGGFRPDNHYCSPTPLRVSGSRRPVLHGRLGSFNGVPNCAEGKARIVSGPFLDEASKPGVAYFLVDPCDDGTPGTHADLQ